MISEAKAFWDAISGKVKSLIHAETENALRMQRYDVTTAPNGTVMGVTQPFGANEIFLPYSKEVAGASVGDTVLVAWWGSMSNAKVYYFAKGYDGGAGGLYVGTDAPTDPNVDFWLDTDEPGQSEVSSVNGKSGVVTLDAGDVGAVSMTQLWTNPNPENSFSAQTVTFSDDYDLYMVIYKRQATGDVFEANTIFRHGYGVMMIHGSGYSNLFYSRDAAWHSGGGLEFHTGYAGTSTANTSVVIPLVIYGIDGVLTP